MRSGTTLTVLQTTAPELSSTGFKNTRQLIFEFFVGNQTFLENHHYRPATIMKYSDRKQFKYNNTHKSRHQCFNTSMSTYLHSQLIA